MRIGSETLKEIENQIKVLLNDNHRSLAEAGGNVDDMEPLKLSIGVTLRDGVVEGTNSVDTKLSFTALKITDTQEGCVYELQRPLPMEVAK